MEFEQLSKGMQDRIAGLRAQANYLKANIKPTLMQRMLDNVLQDLDQIPKLVESEPFVSAMLGIPESQLNAIQLAYDKYGKELDTIPNA